MSGQRSPPCRPDVLAGGSHVKFWRRSILEKDDMSERNELVVF